MTYKEALTYFEKLDTTPYRDPTFEAAIDAAVRALYDCTSRYTLPSFKLYRVRHCAGEESTIGADSAQEACEKLGWLIGNCNVRVLFDPNDYEDPLLQRFLQGRGSRDQ